MRKILVIFLLMFFMQSLCFAEESAADLKMSDVLPYAENNNFGLKTKTGEVITKPLYKKIIRLDNGVWLVQKKYKFGLMDSNGKIIVPIKYRHAERIFGKYAKLGNENDYGLHAENGDVIIPHNYQMIEPLFGKIFLTRKNYKYGIVSYNGKKLLNNDFEDIYMPTPKALRIKFHGEWYEIEKLKDKDIVLPENVERITINNKEFTIKHIVSNTGTISEYSVVTAMDYMLKVFSSISPAYEESIDELMLSQGADTVAIFINFGWLPKFPFTYAKKYAQIVGNPYNGPLSDVKLELKKHMQ